MKKVLQYIKYNLLMNLKMWPTMLLSFVIIPVIFSFFLSFSNQRAYDIKPEPPEFVVHIQNKDKSQTGQVLDQLFQEMAKEKIIVKEKKAADAEFVLTIPEDFGKALSIGQVKNWDIKLGENISQEEGEVFEMLLQPISNQLQELAQLETLTADPNLANQLIQSVNQSLEKANIKEEQVGTRRSLTSNQHFSTASLSFIMSLMVSMALLSAVKPELKGLQKRLSILPLTPGERTIFNWIANALILSFWIVLYILVWKVIDPSTFTGNPLLYGAIILFLVGSVQSIADFIGHFTTPSSAGPISSTITVVWLLLSGIIPFDRLGNSPLAKLLQNNWVEQIFVAPFKLVFQGKGLGDYALTGLVVMVVAILCLTINISILKKKEAF